MVRKIRYLMFIVGLWFCNLSSSLAANSSVDEHFDFRVVSISLSVTTNTCIISSFASIQIRNKELGENMKVGT